MVWSFTGQDRRGKMQKNDHKHKLKIIGALDQWLVGWVYFECVFCEGRIAVDRPVLYRRMTSGGAHGG